MNVHTIGYPVLHQLFNDLYNQLTGYQGLLNQSVKWLFSFWHLYLEGLTTGSSISWSNFIIKTKDHTKTNQKRCYQLLLNFDCLLAFRLLVVVEDLPQYSELILKTAEKSNGWLQKLNTCCDKSPSKAHNRPIAALPERQCSWLRLDVYPLLFFKSCTSPISWLWKRESW